jgi:hypothetical protein
VTVRYLTAASAIALAAYGPGPRAAHADDDFSGATVIFARGSSLYRVDARGRDETEIAQLATRAPAPAPRAPRVTDPSPVVRPVWPEPKGARRAAVDSPPQAMVRALRTDAAGTVLLADLAGKWAWMPLDGSTRSLTDLPCADGPAQLAEDGSSVLCRSATSANQSILVELPRGPSAARPGKATAVDVPPTGARVAGEGVERRLVWADANGVWSASPADLKSRSRVALDPPLRGFLASPDGAHAVGVYEDQVFADVKHTRPAEVLMTVQLDGRGARRKAIQDGVAVEWSHDSQWVLVQDGARVCIMRASGGQYKCWRGYTAASLSSDGRWALLLGNRDGSRKQTPRKQAKKPTGKAARPAPPPPDPEPPQPGDMPWDHIDEPSNEPEGPDTQPADDDVSVAPPSGPLSLFRARLEGAFTDRPALLVKVVDGAAVWVPRGATTP